MSFWLFLIILLLLANSKDRDAARTGEQMLTGVLAAFGLMAVGFILMLGFEFAPTFTKWALIAAAAGSVTLLIRWIYKRFFSRQAQINRGYQRMHKRYYALSWAVRVDLESHRPGPEELPAALKRAERILKECREEHARYSQLPPETDGSAYRTQFYIEDIQRLEDLLRSFYPAK